MAKQVHDNTKFTDYRLPTHYRPTHYDLRLNPDLERFIFDGTVKISYSCSPDSKDRRPYIVLHALDLEIYAGHIESTDEGDNKLLLSTVTYAKDTETACLEFASGVPVSGLLVLHFKGRLQDSLKGFYRTKYLFRGREISAAATQFAPTSARLCFPCWDEPETKATFTLTIEYGNIASLKDFMVDHEMVCLSNTPVAQLSLGPDGKSQIFQFQMTPKMSTYLLAFVVGYFDHIETKDSGGRKYRVYSTPGKAEQGRYALDVATKSLLFYEQYFGIKYPLDKLDLVAVPDLSYGAMENWGLVTYRERCILVDLENTSTSVKQNVALIVAHELAHQWFGNLVTMEWWTHLWLNEGFATFMEYLCVNHIFPDYDIWSQFTTESYMVALQLDALQNSHPVEVPVMRSAEIDEIFDDISYHKGSAIIRMLYIYIGDDCFRKGMKQYLNKFAYKNAVTEDLWESLETASQKPVRKLMSGWTLKRGFPWLSVSLSSIDDKSVRLHLKQRRFTADGRTSSEDDNLTWMIPLSAIKSSDPTRVMPLGLMEDEKTELVIDDAADGWIKLNPATTSCYRTAYPEDLVMKMKPAIKDKSLPAMDRLGLQDDFFALCQAGKVQTVALLELLRAFTDEDNYIVWSSIDGCLGKLNILFAETDFWDKFHSFGRDLYQVIFSKLTWSAQPGEKHTDAMTRALVLSGLVTFNDEKIVEEARQRFRRHLSGSEMIPADLRSAIYNSVAKFGDDSEFEGLFEVFNKTDLQEEQVRVACALVKARDPRRLERAVGFVLSDKVRKQDLVSIFYSIGVSNPSLAWQLLQDHIENFKTIFFGSFLLQRLVRNATKNLKSESKAQEVGEFFAINVLPGAERTVQQSIETIRSSASWLARDFESVKEYFSR